MNEPHVATDAHDESELDIHALLGQLIARKWLILSFVAVGLILGSFKGQLSADKFQATSVVQIEQRSGGSTLPSELIGDTFGVETRHRMETELHVIRSRLILEPVIEKLNLNVQVHPTKVPVIGEWVLRRPLGFLTPFLSEKYSRYGDKLTVQKMAVSDALLNQRVTLQVLANDQVRLTLKDGRFVEADIGSELNIAEDISVLLKTVTAPAGRVYTLRKSESRLLVGRLRSRLSVRERGRSGIIDFYYSAASPQQSATIVNTVVGSYQSQSLNRRSAEIDQSIAFIEEQLPVIRNDGARATLSLSGYRNQEQTNELSLGTQDILSRAIAIETQLEELDFQEKQMAQRLTRNHPTYQALLIQRSELEHRLEELRASLETVPETEQELARLTADSERFNLLEAQLVARIEQLRVIRASTVGNIRVLEPADSGRLIGPQRKVPSLLGLGAGFLLGTLLVFAYNFLRRGIDDVSIIEKMGMPLFATINRVKGLREDGSRSGLYALAYSKPQDITTEALRGLRTGLKFSLAANASRSLMITSCAPSDGKSFISFNLGVVAAQGGSRVLLIDADMRRGVLGHQFDLPKKAPGLSDLLAGSIEFDDVVVRSQKFGLDFIAAGSYPPNPAELLSAPTFLNYLTEFEKHYDLVIVDSPPALAVTDPGIIGQHVGMSLLIIRHLATSKEELRSAQKVLGNSGVQVSGVIVNQFDVQKSRFGSNGNKYGYYGAYSYKYE